MHKHVIQRWKVMQVYKINTWLLIIKLWKTG